MSVKSRTDQIVGIIATRIADGMPRERGDYQCAIGILADLNDSGFRVVSMDTITAMRDRMASLLQERDELAAKLIALAASPASPTAQASA